MARGYTEEEKDFNECIKLFGNYPTFKYTDFDVIQEVKDMLDFFLTNVKQGKLNSLRPLENMIKDYYEKNNLRLIGAYDGKIRDGETMCDLFQITSLSLGISLYSHQYRGIKRMPHSYISIETQKKLIKKREEAEEKERVKKRAEKLAKYPQIVLMEEEAKDNKLKVKNWLQYCIAVNQAKKFISIRYQNKWEHNKDGTDKTYTKIKQLANDIREVDDSLMYEVLYEIGSKKIQLNKINLMKATRLLSLNLPNVDTLSVSKKIVKSLVSPYL